MSLSMFPFLGLMFLYIKYIKKKRGNSRGVSFFCVFFLGGGGGLDSKIKVKMHKKNSEAGSPIG